MHDIDHRLAGDGVKLDPFYDRTDLVGTTLRTVGHNLLEGAVLVTLVLFVFLLDLRAALMVGTLIPLSLLTSFIYLHLRGMSANLLSMGAVDFGVIVDGGVVIVEAILARMALREQAERARRAERIREATRSVVRPTVFALLIIIAAYLPIFLLQRVEGRIFAPMANTVVAALVGALFFSVTLVPVLAAIVCRKPVTHRESPLLTWVDRRYEPTLRFCLKHPGPAPRRGELLLAGAAAVLPRLGSEFLPELNEGALYMTFTLPGEHLAQRGAQARAAHHPAPRARARGGVGALAARPARGRHRPEAGQQPRVLREAQAARSVAARDAPPWRSVLEVLQRRDRGDPGHRGELHPAHPRQRQREHQRPAGADRGEALRRRPRPRCRPRRRR